MSTPEHVRSFIRIRRKVKKIKTPILKKQYDCGQASPPWHTFLYKKKNDQFEFHYIYEFATNS